MESATFQLHLEKLGLVRGRPARIGPRLAGETPAHRLARTPILNRDTALGRPNFSTAGSPESRTHKRPLVRAGRMFEAFAFVAC